MEGLAPQSFIDGTRHHDEESGEAVSRIPLGALAPPGTFLDLAPLHLLTTATLDRLRELAAEAGVDADFDVRRYRPNLLLEASGDGFAEDAWVDREVGIGDARLSVSMLAMRCVMTTLAQRDLGPDVDTLRTIARHHRREIAGLGTWACAGVYASVTQAGTVRVGDELG